MFDLDKIEQDWKENSFRLSEEEIIEIYRSEGATLRKYDEEMDKYLGMMRNYHSKYEDEERFIETAFGSLESYIELYPEDSLGQKILKEREKRRKVLESIQEPKTNYLSKENQKKVIEGSLYMVFDATRGWYNFFDGNLSMEKIYYICLEALMNSVKYVVHCEKPVFRYYVSRSIERNIIKYVAKYMHISYREAYEKIHYWRDFGDEFEEFKSWEVQKPDFVFPNENQEEPEKPSQIYYRLRNESCEVNYIENTSYDEFMLDYQQTLEKLDEDARTVVQLTFDEYGYRGLTNREIAEYLGVDTEKVSTIRRRGIRALRRNYQLRRHL